MDLLSSKTILLGLIPVLGIGAGYFFLGPLKKMFSRKGKKHKEQIAAGENKVKELSGKQAEVVARINNLENAEKETRKKVADTIDKANREVEEILKSDKSYQDMATEFDNTW